MEKRRVGEIITALRDLAAAPEGGLVIVFFIVLALSPALAFWLLARNGRTYARLSEAWISITQKDDASRTQRENRQADQLDALIALQRQFAGELTVMREGQEGFPRVVRSQMDEALTVKLDPLLPALVELDQLAEGVNSLLDTSNALLQTSADMRERLCNIERALLPMINNLAGAEERSIAQHNVE